MKVLLTGYAGLLGRYVARALKKEGIAIRVVLNQRTLRRRDFELEADELLWGSLDDSSILKRAVADVDAVIHCAWRSSAQDTQRPTVNERVSPRLFQWSIERGVQRFVFVSSVAVYGMGRRDGSPLTEAATLASDEDLAFIYPAEKVAVENALRAEQRNGAILGIFRPGPIFDDTGSPLKAIIPVGSRSIGLGLGNGRNRMANIHAADVASAIVKWVLHGRGDAVYNITPDVCWRQRDWCRRWAKAKGIRLQSLFIRPWLIRLAAFGATLLKRMLGKTGKIDVRYAIACATRDVTYSNDLVKRELGWTPEVTERYGR